MTLEQLVEIDMEETVKKECQNWACWNELSEMEQEEVFDAYMHIAQEAAKLGFDFANASKK